jgi:hypothetical protein
MVCTQLGYVISRQSKIDVGLAEDHKDINSTVFIHNSGSAIAYISTKPGVSTDSWEVAVGEKIGPFAIKTLYHIGAGVTELKILHLKEV